MLRLYLIAKFHQFLARMEEWLVDAPSIGDFDPEDSCGFCDCFDCSVGECCTDCECDYCDDPDVNYWHPDNDWNEDWTELEASSDSEDKPDDDDDWDYQLRYI